MSFSALYGQMYIDGQTLYGNEWINYDQEYYKMYVKEDGVYRVPYQTLADAGIPLSAIATGDLQLYGLGKQIPIYTSTNGPLTSTDYVEFYAEKNKGDVDIHLYESPSDIFNPFHSMYTDTLAYFLTWGTGNNARLADTPNDLSNLPAAETHFMHESLMVQGNKYNLGKPYSSIYESTFSPGEGFGGSYLTTGTYNVATENVYSAGGDAEMWMRFASAGSVNHNITLSVNGTGIAVDTAAYSGYRMRHIHKTLPASTLTNATSVVLQGLYGSTDKHVVSFIKIKYPRTFNFGNENTFKFKVAADPANKKYLEITDFDHGGLAPILYDITNGLRINTNLTGDVISVALPPSVTERELVLVNPASTTSIDDVFELDFVNYFDTQGDFIIASHPTFIDDAGGHVQAYANYRASTGYNPIIVNLEQIYDQFSYGVNKHVQAVRNLTGFSIENWTTPPKYWFMIGKSRPFYSTRNNPTGQPSYTPTFGHEPSDNLITATPQFDAPRIPFGRIPVVDPDDIRVYLEKVMAYENAQESLPQTVEDRARLKRVIHLGGGDPLIQGVIKNNFRDYEEIITGDSFGANVESFFIENDDPIQTSGSQALDSLINDGTSLITFYGHSSAESLDFNINNPNSYNNTDRYFTMLSMGCYSGQIHQKKRNLSEEFVFAEDKAAVAFIATVDLSGLSALDKFSTKFYENLAGPKYGQGLGDIIQAIITDFENENTSTVNRVVYQQMTLNGDPSIRINNATEPDYSLDASSVTIGPDTPTNRDEIEVCVTVTNLGRSADEEFTIEIERILPDGSQTIVVSDIVTAPKFETVYCYNIPATANSVGLNEFNITVDANDDIVELPNPSAEDNNSITVSAFVLADAIEPVLPKEFRIMPDAGNIVLEATIDPLFAAGSQVYYMEIDTTESFDSPLKMSTTITQSGGTLQWQPAMPYTDSTVYYWRARVDPNIALTSSWETSSFIYIDGEFPGWNQSHFYQFQKDEFDNMTYGDDRLFEFISSFTEVSSNNAHYPILPLSQIDYSINGSRIYDVENCEKYQQGMYLALFDENMEPKTNYLINSPTREGLYDSWICKYQLPVFLYPTDDAGRQMNLENFLNVELPGMQDVEYVLVYSLNDYMPETWNSSLFDAFANYGITDLQNTAALGGVPYVALLDINGGTAEETVGQSLTDIVEGIFLVEGSWHTGSVKSPPICLGAATEWGSVHWGISDQETNDDAHINIYGVQADGTEVLLIEGLKDTDSPYYFSVNEIDATLYPFIRLEYEATDLVNQTAPQLDYWRVLDYIDTDGDTVQDPVDACPDDLGFPATEGCPCLKLDLKVFLEGVFNQTTTEMTTILNTERRILPGQTPTNPYATATPAGQPYSAAPWNYQGTEGAAYTDASYASDVVDWVLISIRTDINKADEIAQVAGLLLKDGSISVPLNCEVQTANPGPFYVVIEHRNHMGVMTAAPISPVNGEITYDFSAQDSYKDNTSVGQKLIGNGVWGMLAGDMDQGVDNVSYDINGTDKIMWESDNGFFDIYSRADLDMNGDVNGSDKIPWVENNGNSSRVPK